MKIFIRVKKYYKIEKIKYIAVQKKCRKTLKLIFYENWYYWSWLCGVT